MKTSLKANLLKHLIAKKEEGGFTLIELLVVIIIIGILAAIALPSFLNQANKARQSEAKTYVGSINKAQQAYLVESARFADSIADTGVGIKSTTEYYSYGDDVTAGAMTVGSFDNTNASYSLIMAAPGPDYGDLKGYTGVIYKLEDESGNTTVTAETCEGNPAIKGAAPTVTVNDAGTQNAATSTSEGECI